MKWKTIPPKALWPLAGLLGMALLLLVGRALIRNKEPLPPTGAGQTPLAPPPLASALHPPPFRPSWEHLSARDLEEAMEESQDPEEILRLLHARLEVHSRAAGGAGGEASAAAPAAPPALLRKAKQSEAGGARTDGGESPPATGPAAREASREPAIREAQTAAIRYAEAMPEKIRRWRALAQLRNLIPRFTVSLDRDRDRTIASSTSAGKTAFSVGPEDESVSVDFGLTWDLANLVWDSAQTSIDTRSRLMVQLRQEVLKETTELYFERRRLQAEFSAHPTDDPLLLRERSLRIEELTAQLDALTGGLYSSNHKN